MPRICRIEESVRHRSRNQRPSMFYDSNEDCKVRRKCPEDEKWCNKYVDPCTGDLVKEEYTKSYEICCGQKYEVEKSVVTRYNINHMDLAPNFAGTLMGLTNCVATLAGVLAPFATGYVINEHPTLTNWRTVFMTACCFFVFGNTVFCLFGTAKQQRWNEPLAMYENNLDLAYANSEKGEKKARKQPVL